MIRNSTGRGIMIKDGQLLLIERWRQDLHYYSIPGGQIESNETPLQAAEREIHEETALTFAVGRLLYEVHDRITGQIHSIFWCDYISGEPFLSPESEERRNIPEGVINRFEPKWVPIAQLPKLPFLYWQPLAQELIADLPSGLPTTTKVLAIN
jgi:8-oxo-dGTP pyrophosphatase MutT (NUDIX family)